MDRAPTWYRIGLLARRNGYISAYDYITALILANVALSDSDVQAIRRAFEDIDFIDLAEQYIHTGEWNDESETNSNAL